MSTFVLVHGAWHGGWCWSKVRPALEAAGGTVYTPTLTGLGDRAHLASPAISLETHVEDVVRLLWFERLADVVLVGHSYAGVVITAVADRVPHQLERLVYLDAAVPKSGQCLLDCTSAQFRATTEDRVRTRGEGWKVPVTSAAQLGLTDDRDIAWTMPRLVPHPYRTFHEPVVLKRSVSPVPRSYIDCIGTATPGGARAAQAEGIDDYHQLATGHDAMVTAPEAVSRLLLRIAKVASDDA